ncbi:hypothetical protein [Rhodococcus sp. NPDC060176]|uniref:hypothetical protein n=1 Tax=Rhodococcus sp. NPDC060176 TaxID=3347062 RepID=UPI00366512A0
MSTHLDTERPYDSPVTRSPALPVHIGRAAPSEQPDTPAWKHSTPGDDTDQQTPISAAALDWEQLNVQPRWLGQESADCVAAIEPSIFTGSGADELRRFSAGARERDETALVIRMLGDADHFGPLPSLLHGADVVLILPDAQGSIGGRRLPTGARPVLAPGLNVADKDLGLRLLNRPDSAPWWSLKLRDTAFESPTGAQTPSPPRGSFEPILIDVLGNPVVAAWAPADGSMRWYVIPDAVDWNQIIDWLVQQAIPHFAPMAARRYRIAGSVAPEWQTPREIAAQDALTDMEKRHEEECARLLAELEEARETATSMRDGLLYGSGPELEEAVARVFEDAHLEILNLDKTGKGTWSADLLVHDQGRRYLVEVKSEGGRAKEALVGDLKKHLATWAGEHPSESVIGGTLIVNHERKTDPSERSRQVYARPEFVSSLDVRVVSTLDLFDLWKLSDWAAIRAAVLGEAPKLRVEGTSHLDVEADAASRETPRRNWFRTHFRKNED